MDVLTHSEILNMPAGREMDKLIAEEIMGLELWYGDPTGFDIPENIDYWRTDTRDSDDELCFRCPYYSTKIYSALEITHKFDYIEIKRLGSRCSVYLENGSDISGLEQCDDMALAICRAALMTLNIE